MSKKIVSAFSKLKRKLQGTREFDVGARFTEVFEKNLFNGGESRSGIGSSLDQTRRLRAELPKLLSEIGVQTFLDAPCGDCHWIALLDWTKIKYTGADVVPALIERNRTRLEGRGMQFTAADLCSDSLPRADVIFCRDCWVHLSYRQIKMCVENFRRSGAEYLMTTTFTARSKNKNLGDRIWRPLNFQAVPFCFPEPLRLLVEDCTEDEGAYRDKAMGLWRLKDLPA